jgi:hypothetical protein
VLQSVSPLPSASKQLLCEVRSFGEDHNLLSAQGGIKEKRRSKACRQRQKRNCHIRVSPFVTSLKSNKIKTSTKKLLTPAEIMAKGGIRAMK